MIEFGELNLYGLNKLIKEYADYPDWLPLPCIYEHGWTELNDPLGNELKSNLPLVLVPSERRKNAWARVSNKDIVIIGFPFINYRRLHNIKRRNNAKGTIVYPAHSTALVKSVYDIDEYCRQLNNLPDDFKPISVSVYDLDMKSGIDKIFMKYGIDVVSAGERTNPNFARNFYRILQRHKYASSNEINSAVFYAVEMGIPFFLLGTRDIINHGNDPHEEQPRDCEIVKKVYDLFSTGPIKCISDEQRDFIYAETGVNESLNAEELKKLLVKHYLKLGLPNLFNLYWNDGQNAQLNALPNFRAIRKLYKELLCSYLKCRMEYLYHRYEQIALYGGGEHTKWFLKLVKKFQAIDSNLKFPQIIAILDDAPKCQYLIDVPVHQTEVFDYSSIDAVVISSDTISQTLKENWDRLGIAEIPCIDLYDNTSIHKLNKNSFELESLS